MTTSLATCFGMFASLMRASISEEDLTLLVAEFPDYMWLTIKYLTMQTQEWLKNASNEEWCDILDRMSHYLESENAKEKFDKLINEDPYNFQRLLEADGKLIEGDKQLSESTFWLFYWAALYAAWATSQHKLPPWSPNFIDGKPHKQAMSDQSLRASITTTLRSLKPGTPQPKGNRAGSQQRAPSPGGQSPSRAQSPRRNPPPPIINLDAHLDVPLEAPPAAKNRRTTAIKPPSIPSTADLMLHSGPRDYEPPKRYSTDHNKFAFNKVSRSYVPKNQPGPSFQDQRMPGLHPPSQAATNDTYANFEDIIARVQEKCEALDDSECEVAARQLYMRLLPVKAAAKILNFFQKAQKCKQLGAILKAHMCALSSDIPAVTQALQDWLRFMQGRTVGSSPETSKRISELKKMWQSIPQDADWTMSATMLAFSFHTEENTRLSLMSAQTAAQWWNAVIRNLATTTNVVDFDTVQTELENLGATVNVQTPDWINQWMVPEDENPHHSVTTAPQPNQPLTTATQYQPQTPTPMPTQQHQQYQQYQQNPPHRSSTSHMQPTTPKNSLLPFPPTNQPPEPPVQQPPQYPQHQGQGVTLMITQIKDVPYKDLENEIEKHFGFNSGLQPAAIHKGFWFLNSVNPHAWNALAQGKEKVWLHIGNNKYIGVRSKNEFGDPYEPPNPAKRRKTESTGKPAQTTGAPPPPPPAATPGIVPGHQYNPYPPQSPMYPWYPPHHPPMPHMQPSFSHYQPHLYENMHPMAHPTPDQQRPAAETARINAPQSQNRAARSSTPRREDLPPAQITASSASIPAAPGVTQEKK